MHTAKELHDWLEASNLFEPDARQIILRALSLLASVEDEDGIVRELGGFVDHLHERGHDRDAQLVDDARALIVSQRQEIERVKGERDRLNSAIRWALGYNEGEPQFQPRGENDPPYWWRDELMRRAAHPKDAP